MKRGDTLITESSVASKNIFMVTVKRMRGCKTVLHYFVGGIVLGVVLGVLVGGALLSIDAIASLGGVATILGAVALAFVGGLFLGSFRQQPKPRVRLSGRVFDFPQAPAMVEIALRRMRAIVGRE